MATWILGSKGVSLAENKNKKGLQALALPCFRANPIFWDKIHQ
jgi:hypothetical protein